MQDMKLAAELEKDLEERGVAAVYLFGSRVAETAKETSDFDFAILFKAAPPAVRPQPPGDLYLLFSRYFEAETDLIVLNEASLPLQFEIIKTGKVIFDLSPVIRADFEEKIMLEYLEFLPYLKAYEEATFETFK